jgi:hypothetical protein
VSSSGLIYAAIAVMWAAVLIPMWLRGHDNTVENRSAERFGQAMRVLSRRPTADEVATEGAADGRVDDHEVSVPTSSPRRADPRPASPAARPRQGAQAVKVRPSLARRRARTLGVLTVLTLLLAVAAVVGVLPVWLPLPVFALLVAFVVHLRNQAKRAATLRARRRAPQPAVPRIAEPEAPQVEEPPAADGQSSRLGRFVQGPSRAVVVETKRVRHTSAEGASVDEDEWRPNPLPLPTYVTAPKAMRPIKVIDLTTPGAWSSGRLLDDEGVAEEDLLAAELAADELDGMLEHEAKGSATTSDDGDAARRAVGD